MKPRIEVLRGEDAVAMRAAEMTRELAKGRRFSIALSGGSTPKLFHRALAGMTDIAWDRIDVFYSDERAVPPDHEHSNHRMAKETLLDHVPIPARNVHRVHAEDGDTVAAAARYQGELLLFAEDGACDLVMLGMGADGHTASLFPGREPKDDGLVVAATAPPESPIERRVTFSYLALERARNVIVMVTGASKAERLAEVLGERSQLPLRKVFDRRRETILLVDEPAASQLKEKQ
jgi:6-phosphogluconolactonase